jgi:putative phosphoesterase
LSTEARFKVAGLEVAMHHGSVESCTEYVFEEDATESMLTRARCGLLILGHTHAPYVRRFPSGLIVNPGSVGQPRDGDPRASYALLDTDSHECEILRLDYDIDKAASAIESAGLPRFLADRLSVGR